MIFFTSDHHFGHKNILEHQSDTRDFKTIHEMNKYYINTWNTQVSEKDIVYHLGDFTLGDPTKYLEKLKGQIKIVPGNHDRWVKKSKFQNIRSKSGYKVEILPLIYVLNIDKQKFPPIVLCHYPMLSWPHSHYNSWHLHGHTHRSLYRSNFAAHVGVDETDGVLWSIDNIKTEMKRWKIKE